MATFSRKEINLLKLLCERRFSIGPLQDQVREKRQKMLSDVKDIEKDKKDSKRERIKEKRKKFRKDTKIMREEIKSKRKEYLEKIRSL